MATFSARMGNPTEPMAQGLLSLLPSESIIEILLCFFLCQTEYKLRDAALAVPTLKQSFRL